MLCRSLEATAGLPLPVASAALVRALSASHAAALAHQHGVLVERVLIIGRGPVPFEMAPVESRRVETRLASL